MKTAASATPAVAQADALVAEIDRLAAERVHALEAAARDDVADIRRRARVKARRQQRRAIARMRVRQRERIALERAALETEARRRESAGALAALAAAWPMLIDAIAGRWRDALARRCWIEAAIARAASCLRSRAWRIRHAPTWNDDDRAVLERALRAHGIEPVAIDGDATLDAGLVVEADGASLDATPAALLADRAGIEAALLAAIAAEVQASTAATPGDPDGTGSRVAR